MGLYGIPLDKSSFRFLGTIHTWDSIIKCQPTTVTGVVLLCHSILASSWAVYFDKKKCRRRRLLKRWIMCLVHSFLLGKCFILVRISVLYTNNLFTTLGLVGRVYISEKWLTSCLFHRKTVTGPWLWKRSVLVTREFTVWQHTDFISVLFSFKGQHK